MHIKAAEPGTGSGTGTGISRPNEGGPVRKLRLGSASRVPLQNSAKATNSPLRSLVSAISHSLGSKTPAKSGTSHSLGAKTPARSSGSSGARSSLSFSSSCQTPRSSTSSDGKSHHSYSSGRPSTSTRLGGTASTSKIPSTPTPSRLLAMAGTPSRRTSVSSTSSSSSSISLPTQKRQTIPATPSTQKRQTIPATPSTTRKSSVAKKPGPTTSATKLSSISCTTPTAENNPTTPTSRVPSYPLPTPRKPNVSSTPAAKQSYAHTPYQTRSKTLYPTTPVSQPPTTPVNCENSNNTPYTMKHHSTPKSLYTPKNTPLQPRNYNVSESSRRLHFGIDLVAMAQQENVEINTPHKAMGSKTPVSVGGPVFCFDKERLAHIKARRNTPQSLKSPAQRIRILDMVQPSQTPCKSVQPAVQERPLRSYDAEYAQLCGQSPSRRRLANSLF